MAVNESEELTRVGAGTLMGEFMRQYWIPAAMSSELKADGAPLRLMLLGEQLIAFRDSSGRVGVMDHRCPHRCATLFIGRNEEDGIRCVYHGWKFDVEGNCVDMPSVPAHQDFKDKVKAKAYKTAERNGLIWVYMGKREEAPAFPGLEILGVPEADVTMWFALRECNWMQALEGDIDTSHFGFLHVGHVDPEEVPENHPIYNTITNRTPELRVTETEWGTTYGAFRPAPNGQRYWRIANFLFPFWTQQPQGEIGMNVHARAWVPMDDTHTMFIHIGWNKLNRAATVPLKNDKPLTGMGMVADYLPNTTDWYGRWRLAANPRNDWKIDRDAQKQGIAYSGIDNVHLQDQAVTESMGPITDHAFEHLAPTDQMIARTRRHIVRTARAFRDAKTTPPGVDDPKLYLQARSGFFWADPKTDWREAYEAQVKEAVRPGIVDAAE
jgi:phthalate 4,5-dioxygenase oxygenase subunit